MSRGGRGGGKDKERDVCMGLLAFTHSAVVFRLDYERSCDIQLVLCITL